MKSLLFKISIIITLVGDSVKKFFLKIKNKWMANNSTCVRLVSDGSCIFPSKKLFLMIYGDHPKDDEYYILFTCLSNGEYAFFVNPDWEKHGVDDPKRYMTQQLVIMDGLFGTHIYQPTVDMILWKYGIHDNDTTIKVKREMFNGEPYYVLKK